MISFRYIKELERTIIELHKDIENKENTIINLLDANKELSISNNAMEKRAELQKKVIEELNSENRWLYKKVSEGDEKLDNIENYLKMLIKE